MTKQTKDLFTHRSSTQEFLFSRSQDASEEKNRPENWTGPKDSKTAPFTDHFPELLDYRELTKAVDTQMDSASVLFAMSVKFDLTSELTNPSGLDDVTFPEDMIAAVTPLAETCHAHGGVWGQVNDDEFACVFPGLGESQGIKMAEGFQKRVADDGKAPVTIGVATYPTIDFTRGQIVDNAQKALVHAGFFDPGAIIFFDAVSLNISGDHYYQTGDLTGAMDEYKKGLALNPNDANLYNSLGVCQGVQKDYENALAAFENAIRLAPKEVMPRYNKGYILLLQNDRKAALENFLAADEIESGVFEVVFHIGQTYVEINDLDSARPYLESATRTNPRSGPAFRSLGTCLSGLGLTKEAIGAFTQTVKLNPTDAPSLSNLGDLYIQRNESLEVASALCEQSVRLSPENGLFRHRLAEAFFRLGRLDQALEEYEKAAALGHDSQSRIEETQERLVAVKAS